MDGSATEDKVWATLVDPGTNNQGEVIELNLDRTEMDGGVQKAVWKGEWTREEHDLPDLSQHTPGMGESSAIVTSTGGEFHPIAMGIEGPMDLTDFMESVTIGSEQYDLIAHEGRALLAVPGKTTPRAFVTIINSGELELPLNSPLVEPAGGKVPAEAVEGGLGDLALGVAAGLWQTVPDNVMGLWDGVKFVAKQGWSYLPPTIIYRVVTTGNLITIEDKRRFETAKGVALKIAQIVYKLNTDRQAFINALMTGDDATVNALGEEYRIAFEFAAEMIDSLWDSIVNLPAYDKGKIIGRVVGEVVLTVLSAGVGTALKGATMAGVAAKLKQVSYLQQFAGKFDDLILFYNKIHNWTDGLDNIGDGKAIAQRALANILHKKLPNEGHWQAFERFLAATNTAARRGLIDSHLSYVVNRIMRESYKEAADIIRNGGTLTQAMEKVPTITRMNSAMGGRKAAAFLEAHHTATKKWMKELVQGITDAQLDSMPALVMDKAWHRQFNNSGLPRDFVFHNILREQMHGVNGGNRQAVVDALERTYKIFEGLDVTDPAPDTWVVIKKWIDVNVP